MNVTYIYHIDAEAGKAFRYEEFSCLPSGPWSGCIRRALSTGIKAPTT